MQEEDLDSDDENLLTQFVEEAKTAQRLYPELPTKTNGNEKEEKQSTLGYLCAKLQVINEDKLDDFLAAQVYRVVKELGKKNPDWNEFAAKAFENFFELVDKKKTTELWLKFQESYIPDMVNASIEDIRMNIIILMIIEKVVDYAQNAGKNSEENVETIWNDELTLTFIEWVSPNLNGLCQSIIKKYLDQCPVLEEEEAILTTKPKTSSVDIAAEAKTIVANSAVKLHARIKRLEQQLKKANSARPCSESILLLKGAILGWGSYFVLSMLSRATCDYLPCIEHFEPDSMLGSLFYAMIGTVATTGILYHLRDIKNLQYLVTTLATQSGSKAVKTYLKIKQLAGLLKSKSDTTKKPITKSPWHIFEDTLTEEQISLLPDTIAAMFKDVYNGNVAEFAEYYLSFVKAVKRDGPQSVSKEYIYFVDFMSSLNENQIILFKNVIKYIKELNSKNK